LNKKESLNVREAAKKMLKSNHEHVYDFDQKILEKFIWPLAENDVVINEEYIFIRNSKNKDTHTDILI